MNTMKFQLTLIITFLFSLTSCNPLPKKMLSQSGQKIEYEVYNDSLRIQYTNPINCPIRISAKSSNKVIQEKIAKNFPLTIDSKQDTVLTYWTDKSKDEIPLKFSGMMGGIQMI